MGRDETHRFAVTYHRKRRELRDFTSELTAIPGVGKKTAERIVLELKDRLAQIAAPAVADVAGTASSPDRLRGDLLSALQNLGYHRPQAEKAIDSALSGTGEPSFDTRLKVTTSPFGLVAST